MGNDESPPGASPRPPAGSLCPWCGVWLDRAAAYCHHCGRQVVSVPPDSPGLYGHVPSCPRCRQPVRVIGDAPFPRRPEGRVDVLPWNAEWDGRCEHCGLAFEMTVATDSRRDGAEGRWGVRRVTTVRPDQVIDWIFLDLQQCQAGIAITVRTTKGDAETVERLVLTVSELRQLMAALNGPLSPLLEQRDWTHDTT